MSGLPVAGGRPPKFLGARNAKTERHDQDHNEKRRTIEGGIFLVLFSLTIPAANWMIGHVGVACLDGGPCLVRWRPG